MEVTIRNATPQDAKGIAVIHVKTWQCAYKDQISDVYLNSLDIEQRTEGWKKELENPYKGSYYLVAEMDNQIVGWCTGGINRDEDASKETGEVYAIYMHPNFIGKGIGSKLMERMIALLKKDGYKNATLWVLNTNTKTKEWYKKNGWTEEGKIKTDKRPNLELHEVRYIKKL